MSESSEDMKKHEQPGTKLNPFSSARKPDCSAGAVYKHNPTELRLNPLISSEEKNGPASCDSVASVFAHWTETPNSKGKSSNTLGVHIQPDTETTNNSVFTHWAETLNSDDMMGNTLGVPIQSGTETANGAGGKGSDASSGEQGRGSPAVSPAQFGRRQSAPNSGDPQHNLSESTKGQVVSGIVSPNVSGDKNGKKIIRIAWTIDDGPQDYAKDMQVTGLGGATNVTWYIQHNRMRSRSWDKSIEHLLKIQKQGGEIAIHSFHDTADHAAWFPMSKGPDTYTYPYAGKPESEIMDALDDFYNRLRGAGIIAKFVRLPGGLISELEAYAKSLGITPASDVAHAIIDGNMVALKKYGVNAVKINNDYKIMKGKLSALDLLLWSGTAAPAKIANQSWEAESAGVEARQDDVTEHVSVPDKRKKNYREESAGRFERIIHSMRDGDARSLVVLAHDSYKEDVIEVKADKEQMEKVAKQNHVKIEYHTMSSLFKYVTGKDAASYDVIYK